MAIQDRNKQQDVDKDTLIKVSVSLGIIMLLVGIATFIKMQEGYPMQKAMVDALSLVTHIEVGSGGSGPILYLFSIMGALLNLFILITIISIIYEGRLKDNLDEVRLMKKLEEIDKHVIICGGGRVGGNVAKELLKKNVPFVIVEGYPEAVKSLRDAGALVVEGNSLDKEVLKVAGVDRAKMVISSLDKDGDNLLQVITVRDLNKDVEIISRADYPRVVDKLKAVGAKKVILPAIIGGQRIAHEAMEDLGIENIPDVTDTDSDINKAHTTTGAGQ